MKILLLEDDLTTSAHLLKGLGQLGHQVDCRADGLSALGAVLGGAYDVLVLDRMVPALDGLSVLRTARSQGCKTPAMLLTAVSSIEDRVAGLEAGADDYLVKPFAFAELSARLNALARRPPPAEVVTLLRAGDVEMDLLGRVVRRAGRIIELQPREYSMLHQLLLNRNRVMTRTMLLERVWNFGFDPRTNIVETHISRLRAKLNHGFEADLIRTVRGSGYMIADDAE